MKDFEKLGLFYLGREYDLAAARTDRRARALRFARPRDARGVRRHDGQRQDRALPGPARGSRDRRRAGHRDRSERGSRQPAADVSRPLAGGFPAVDRRRRGAARGADAGRLRRGRRRSKWKKGLAEWGQDGARIERLRARGRFRHLHAGKPRRTAGLDPRARSPRRRRPSSRRSRAAGGARQQHRHEPARRWPASTPRRAAASTRCWRRSSRRLDGAGTDLDLRVADPAGSDAAVPEGRHPRSRVVLSRRRSASTWRCS